MGNVFGFRAGQPVSWFDKRLSKSNQHCLYCGVFVGEGSEVLSDREHLIARNFVPKGTLDSTAFNFIFRCCRECNNRKSQAERHVSSVTLFNSPARLLDEQVDAIAQHKASRDYHPNKKGILVQDASDNHSIEFHSESIQMRFDLISPPQTNYDEVVLLACNHVQALFALLTTENPLIPEKSRLLPPDQCFYYGNFGYKDWGNPHLLEISRRVAEWPCHANVNTANGYFKGILRRSPDETEGWFWALEWNQFVRVFGAISEPGTEPKVFSYLPGLAWKSMPNCIDSLRAEIPISENIDILFSVPAREKE